WPDAFAAASHHLDVTLGTINTGVLILSSLTMALAVRSAQLGRRRAIQMFLVLTILLGATFLAVKMVEYHHKSVEHLIPGSSFRFPIEQPGHAAMFFCLYFAMTGLHALHMIIGIGLLAVMFVMAGRGR